MAEPGVRQTEGQCPDGAKKGGIGFGLFLLLVGCALLAERLGWLPQRLDWLFPVILIAWGASEVFQRLRGN